VFNFKFLKLIFPHEEEIKTVPVNFVVVTVVTFYCIYYEIYWNSLYMKKLENL
jgi:hypothetical protein